MLKIITHPHPTLRKKATEVPLADLTKLQPFIRDMERTILKKAGQEYIFLKQGQRNCWQNGEIPLLETKGNDQLSKPLASIIILEATHFKEGEKILPRVGIK